MTQVGLTAKAVTAVTKGEAEKKGENIWALVEHETSVILVSPEMLSTPGFTNSREEGNGENEILETSL